LAKNLKLKGLTQWGEEKSSPFFFVSKLSDQKAKVISDSSDMVFV
jgi:hypothetical protein